MHGRFKRRAYDPRVGQIYVLFMPVGLSQVEMEPVIMETNISKGTAIENTFLLSDLNLRTPAQGVCTVIFLRGNALSCLPLFLRNSPSLFKLEKQKCHNNCETIQRKSASFCQFNWSLLSLERTRRNQQMKWKLRKLLAPKESYLGVLPLVDHSLSLLFIMPIYWP